MSGVDNTSEVFYHYLRALHVKVSKMTVHRLLDNPLGNSMRGISDALDSLHINNAVYQLPTEYFDKLESPFIAVTSDNDSPFCLVEEIEEAYITIIIPHYQHMRVSKQQFLQKWTGGVLVSEVTERTSQEKNCWLKNAVDWIQRYQLLLAATATILLILCSASSSYSTGMVVYLFTLCIGILVSSAILYKETVNSKFLHHFCHIGKVIDCNEVLHSKGSHIIGIGLGELSLFYFSTLLLFTLIRPYDFYYISLICNITAIGFTIFSVIYQIFIIRKGCMLCMVINLIVWSNCLILYLIKDQYNQVLSIQTVFLIITISCIYLIIWIQLKKLLSYNEERKQLKTHFSGLLSPQIFQAILAQEPQIREMPKHDITLHNDVTGENQLLFVTNPNCKNCAKTLLQVQKIADEQPISLVLLTFPGDDTGKQVALIIISIYLTEGWKKAMDSLLKWHKNHHIENPNRITNKSKEIWKQQQLYCLQQQINETPTIIANKHYLPYIYQIENLKYVLT